MRALERSACAPELGEHLVEAERVRPHLCDRDDVARIGEELSVTTEDLAHDSLDPVAAHGRRDLACDRDPEARRTTLRTRQHGQNEVGGVDLPS